MALTTKEELDLLSGTITPTDSDYSVEDLAKQIAIGEAQSFLSTVKSPDQETNPDAYIYADQMVRLCGRIINNEYRYVALAQIIISLVGDTATTFATISTSDTDAWATFIANNMFETLERAALVTPAQKTDYDGLP